jgi:hypothetical protein
VKTRLVRGRVMLRAALQQSGIRELASVAA